MKLGSRSPISVCTTLDLCPSVSLFAISAERPSDQSRSGKASAQDHFEEAFTAEVCCFPFKGFYSVPFLGPSASAVISVNRWG